MNSTTTFIPVREISQGGQGVPVALYKLTHRGETLKIVGKAREALDWLAHPYRQSAAYACYAVIDGEEREVLRNL